LCEGYIGNDMYEVNEDEDEDILDLRERSC